MKDPQSAVPAPSASPCYVNRELSWLQFNRRVLEEAEDPANPLCERLNFASIFQSNLDEFYMVRVGMLMDTLHLTAVDDKTGLTSAQQTAAILDRTRELLAERDHICRELLTELAGIIPSVNVPTPRLSRFISRTRIEPSLYTAKTIPTWP